MLFLIHFTDRAEASEIRATHLHEHMAWLAANAATVRIAGLLLPEADTPHVGAIWIVNAPGRAAALAVADTDPFWINGLRKSREIYHYDVRTALPVAIDG